VAEPLERVVLTGQHVQLEPLWHDHVPGLLAAADLDRSTFAYTDVPVGEAAMSAYVDKLLAEHARGTGLPFAQRRLDTGQLAGCTRYLEVRWWQGGSTPDELEIGGTWLAANAQRSPINTEAKLLLLTHAFDTLGVWRVAICTDAQNQRSRDAITRIGATFEGVLRSHRLRYNAAPPQPRDTAVYSIIDHEWPRVRAHLQGLLTR
jgi:RimJ/RimL family protein N-acetyltransferase